MSSSAPVLTPDQINQLRSHTMNTWAQGDERIMPAVNIGGQVQPSQASPASLPPTSGPTIGPTRTFRDPRLESLWANARRVNQDNQEAPNSWVDTIKRIGHFASQLLSAPELEAVQLGMPSEGLRVGKSLFQHMEDPKMSAAAMKAYSDVQKLTMVKEGATPAQERFATFAETALGHFIDPEHESYWMGEHPDTFIKDLREHTANLISKARINARGEEVSLESLIPSGEETVTHMAGEKVRFVPGGAELAPTVQAPVGQQSVLRSEFLNRSPDPAVHISMIPEIEAKLTKAMQTPESKLVRDSHMVDLGMSASNSVAMPSSAQRAIKYRANTLRTNPDLQQRMLAMSKGVDDPNPPSPSILVRSMVRFIRKQRVVDPTEAVNAVITDNPQFAKSLANQLYGSGELMVKPYGSRIYMSDSENLPTMRKIYDYTWDKILSKWQREAETLNAKASGIDYNPTNLPGVKPKLNREAALDIRAGQRWGSRPPEEEPPLPEGYDWSKAARPKTGYTRVYRVNVLPEDVALSSKSPHTNEELDLIHRYWSRASDSPNTQLLAPDLFHTTDPNWASQIRGLFGPNARLSYVDVPASVVRRGQSQNLPSQFQSLFLHPSETLIDRQNARLLMRGKLRPEFVPMAKKP